MVKQKIEQVSARATVTLTEVATRAGVSVMTASRALSGEGYISEALKQKVVAAADSLGYLPNLSARVMRGKRTNILGLMVNDLNSADVTAIVGEITNAARGRDKELLIYNMLDDNGRPRSGGSVKLLSGVCDGLLMLQRVSDELLDILEKTPTPVVLVNYWRTPTSLPVVRADNFVSARDAVRHLLQLGHRRIGFIGGTPYSGQSGERQRGYLAALAEQGITPPPEWVETGTFSQLSGLEAGRRLLALANRPTAIFAANDGMAFGVMDAARAMELSLPDELSVIGFDDIAAAAHTHPPLTTIGQPLQRLAEAAVHELLARIDKSPQRHSCIELPSEVVIRATTAAPANRPHAPR